MLGPLGRYIVVVHGQIICVDVMSSMSGFPGKVGRQQDRVNHESQSVVQEP